jgi:hypothetical protein
MDSQRFDDLTRALAAPRTRRGFLGAVAATLAAAFTAREAGAAPGSNGSKPDKPSKCYGAGSHCTNANQCCSGTCTNRTCAPEPVCDPGAIEACYSGPAGTMNVGICRAGTRTCHYDGSGWGPCSGQVLPGAEDTCNGIDDDCDGAIDNGLDCTPDVCEPGSTEPCYTGAPATEGVGICHGGNRRCNEDGSGWGACEGEQLPIPEACDGFDNNCDGVIDNSDECVPELCRPGEKVTCYSGSEGTAGVGICAAGEMTCLEDGSGWGPCTGEVLPQPETCNNLDDDCDGDVDEGTICPPLPNATSGCIGGECGIVTCNGGYSDCNGNRDDGCETFVLADRQNCGACGHVCPGGPNGVPSCVQGFCGLSCLPGWSDCNGIAADGCECPTGQGAVCLVEGCCIAPGREIVTGFECCLGENPDRPGFCL